MMVQLQVMNFNPIIVLFLTRNITKEKFLSHFNPIIVLFLTMIIIKTVQ